MVHLIPHPCSTPTPSPASGPRLPRRLGAYELLERVGAGGMAEVWMARRALIPGALKICALKIIHGRIAARDRHRRMFLQEARLALKLRHANLVSVFDVGEADGRLYMALEWVDGVHLRDFAQHVRARRGRLSVPLVCHVMSELLQGLRHAHELRVGGHPLEVVHRDVAPHNVLVSAAGEVKLADFGIARVEGELSSGEHVKGRARYMAPEQLYGRPTQASDLFAVGAILHELLDGRRFRDGLESRSDWHEVVAEAPLPPLHRTDVPPALEALRVGLLQPDPARRIASADEALAWLLRCPPWPPGATTLRELYAACVGEARRTGFTDPELLRPPRARVAWLRPVPTESLEPSPPPIPRAHPRLRAVPCPSLAPGPARLHALQTRGRTPSWTPTPSPSHATEAGRRLGDAVIIRRRSAPRPCRRAPQPARVLRWLGRGLWGLAGLLAVTAAVLALVPSSARPGSCTGESAVPAAERAWLRLRGDDRPLAQVRIDMQTLSVTSRTRCWVTAGPHALAWRAAPDDAWHHVGSHTLVSAKEHLIRVGDDGLEITAYDP